MPEQAAVFLETLAQPQHTGARRGALLQLLQQHLQTHHGRGDDDEAITPRMQTSRVQIKGDLKCGRQDHVRQIAGIAPRQLQGLGLIGVTRPQTHRPSVGRGHSQRRAPRASAKHGDVHCGCQFSVGAAAPLAAPDCARWASNMAWKFTSLRMTGGKPARVHTSETMARK